MQFVVRWIRLSLVILPLTGLSASAGDVRTWTDATGQFTVAATLERLEGDRVILRRQSDDRLLELPLLRLSPADRDHVQTVRPDNPFLLPDEKFAAPKSMVIVRLRMPTGDKTVTGVVVQRVDGRALVAFRFLQMPSEEFDKYAVSVLWRDGTNLKTVPAQLVAPYMVNAAQPIFLASAPAADLPPPLEFKQPAIVLPQAVKVFGFTIPEQAAEKFAPRLADGTLTTELANGQGFRVDGEVDVHDGIVLRPDGEPVGCFLASWPSHDGRKHPATAMRCGGLKTALEPACVRGAAMPLKGDRKTITYGIVAYVSDPLRRMRNPRLLVRFGQPGRNDLNPLLSPPPNGVWKAIPKASAVELDPPVAPETIGPTAPPARLFPGTTVIGGRFAIANPGPVGIHEFAVQVAYTNAAGVETFLPPQLVGYQFSSAANVPDIPGLDMRPLDQPRPVRVKGGWRITDDVTRVDDDANKLLDGPPFPDPVPGGDTAITACESASASVGGRFACYSPDGAWLFILDKGTTLRKYNAATMKEMARVDLGAPCTDMTFGKAGLLLAADRIQRVWVLDPATLARRHEIAVPGLRLVAAAPQSDIGVASGEQFHVVNFQTGKKLHSLSRYRQPPPIDATTGWPIHDVFWGLRMTADGTYLMAFDRGLKRFRFEGEDLIYEARGKDLINHGDWNFSVELSGDGTLVAVPGFVFKRDNLDTPFMAISEPGSVAIDPVNGNIYASSNSELSVFNSRGSKIASDTSCNSRLNLLVVHPRGDRLVGWGMRSPFVYRDFRNESR